MKNILFLLALALTGCAVRPPTPVPTPIKDWSITATWQYDFSNFPACSPTLTAGCVNSFTWGYLLKGTTQVPVKTTPLPFQVCVIPVPNPLTAPCADTTTTPLTFHDTGNGVLGIGAVTPYVVANGLDNNGVVVSSVTDLGPVDNIVIGAPTNAGWTRK